MSNEQPKGLPKIEGREAEQRELSEAVNKLSVLFKAIEDAGVIRGGLDPLKGKRGVHGATQVKQYILEYLIADATTAPVLENKITNSEGNSSWANPKYRLHENKGLRARVMELWPVFQRHPEARILLSMMLDEMMIAKERMERYRQQSMSKNINQ